MSRVGLEDLLQDEEIWTLIVRKFRDRAPERTPSRPQSPTATITPESGDESERTTTTNSEMEYDSAPTSTSSEEEDSPNEGFSEAKSRKRSRKARKNKAAKAPKVAPAVESNPPIPTPSPAASLQEQGAPTPSTSGVMTATANKAPTVKATTAASSSAAKKLTPPPLYIRDKERWFAISAWCNSHRVSYKSARSTAQGIKVEVSTTDDHRALSKMLGEQRIPYHTYTMPEDKLLRAVIKNVPREFAKEEILESLKAQNLPVREVHRMVRGKARAPMNMVLVCLDNTPEGKQVFRITHVCGLMGVKIEPPYKTGIMAQCHKCQMYGHTSNNCYAHPRCVKCLGNHHTSECERPKDLSLCTEPPSCVLCGEMGHPANFRGCPRAPKRTIRPTGPARYYNKAFVPAPLPTHNAWSRPLTQGREAFPALPRTQAPPPPPFTHPPRPQPPTVGHKTPAGGQPKPLMGTPVTKPAPVRVASHALPKTPQGLDPDLALVANFASLIDFAEIREVAAELRRNEGNNLALLNIAIKFSPLLERLGSLSFK